MKGVIYKIYHKDNEDICYIGSTTDLNKRKAKHKSSCNNEKSKDHNLKLYQIIRENGSWDSFQFNIIEEVCCETKRELHQKEDEYINTLNPIMNCRKSFGAETKEEYKKQYYIDNKEQINENAKKYRIDNKEQIKKRDNQYRIDNREKINENAKKYRDDNRERLNENAKKKITCECGCKVSYSIISKHRKSKKHLNLIQHTCSQTLL